MVQIGVVGVDIESTLTTLEGLDVLAETRGPAELEEVRRITERGMSGELPFAESLAMRLRALGVTSADLAKLQELYVANLFPGARETMDLLRSTAGQVALISGGIYEAVRSVAQALKIKELHAIEFDPVTQTLFKKPSIPGNLGHLLLEKRGKFLVMRELIAGLGASEQNPVLNLMIGDGMTDAETKSDDILFISVGDRQAVSEFADIRVQTIAEVHKVLKSILGEDFVLPQRFSHLRR